MPSPSHGASPTGSWSCQIPFRSGIECFLHGKRGEAGSEHVEQEGGGTSCWVSILGLWYPGVVGRLSDPGSLRTQAARWPSASTPEGC